MKKNVLYAMMSVLMIVGLLMSNCSNTPDIPEEIEVPVDSVKAATRSVGYKLWDSNNDVPATVAEFQLYKTDFACVLFACTPHARTVF